MKMSDLVGNLDLAIYPIVGLVLFMSVFIGVTISVMAKRRARELDDAARLPLEDGPVLSSLRPDSDSRMQASMEVRS